MKIAIAGQTWGAVNGPGVFARRLGQRLARRGHQVLSLIPATTLYKLRWSTDEAVTLAQIPAIRVSPSHPEIRITPAPLRAVTTVLEQFQPDVVHIQDHYILSRAALNAAGRMRVPIAATNHFLPANILPHVPFCSSVPKAARIAERFLWKTLVEVLEKTDAIITPTETAASILRPHLAGRSVRAVSCGIDIREFQPPNAAERSVARRHWRIAAEEIVFTYVGRLDFEKRVDLLIRALVRLRPPNVRLFIAGRGHQLARLRLLASKQRLGRSVSLLGFVDDSDLFSLLRASDFFAMPSAAELQSIATLEAMAVGLPVLAADACALPELVENGVNGALFEPGNAIAAAEKIQLLIRNIGTWPNMSKQSRARAARHSIETTTASYEAIYCELMQRALPGMAARYCRSEVARSNQQT